MLVVSAEPGSGTAGMPTLRFVLALAGNAEKTTQLELSEGFHAERFGADLALFLAEASRRLHNPQPRLLHDHPGHSAALFGLRLAVP